MRKNQLLFFVGKSDWVSIASDGVTSGVQSALIASQRAAQGNTTAVNSVREDPAVRLAQANLAYAAQNADQGSMLSKPLADGGMKASNTATAAMQLAAQLNASNGQVTPLLFDNDASAGGGFGLSEAQRNARNGGLNAEMIGVPRDVPNNTVKYNGAAEGAKIAQAKPSAIGSDGLRIGPTTERANLLSRNNIVLRDKNGFIIRPLSDFIEASPQATIRATSNLVKDNPIIMSPVRIAGDVVSLFRADGVNPATGEVATNLNKPYAKLGLAIDAAATFSPLVELRGMIGASKLSPSIEAIYKPYYASAYERGLAKVEADLLSGKISAPAGQPEHLFKANKVDSFARDELREFAMLRGDGADVVRINQRLYIDGIGGKYRIPDVYFPQSGMILDGTLGTKTLNTPQIIDFRTSTRNADIGIVRPESYGGSYWIKK